MMAAGCVLAVKCDPSVEKSCPHLMPGQERVQTRPGTGNQDFTLASSLIEDNIFTSDIQHIRIGADFKKV